MKAVKLIGIIIAILVANNLLLLYFLDEIRSSQFEPSPAVSDSELTASREGPSLINDQSKNTNYKAILKSHTKLNMEDLDSEFVTTLERAIKRDDFKQIWDQYQIQRNDHYTESQRNLSSLEPFELFDLIQNSTDRIERQVAQQILINQGLQGLENHQLKALYQNPSFKRWGRQEIITLLLQNNDPEGLSLAKESLINQRNSPFYSSIDSDVMHSIYEQDPEFMRQYVADFDINITSARFSSVAMFFTQEEELAKVFLKNNLDKILDSEHRYVLQMGSYFRKVEITASQQERVLALFDSKNHHLLL